MYVTYNCAECGSVINENSHITGKLFLASCILRELLGKDVLCPECEARLEPFIVIDEDGVDQPKQSS